MNRLFFLCLALGACQPDLADEGVYGCSDGECPKDFVCRTNQLCYGPNANRFALYETCTEDDQCETRTCNKISTATYGQCGKTCTQSSQCGTVNGRAGVCEVLGEEGLCLGECTTNSDCPDNHECLIVPMTEGERACHSLPASYLDVILCTMTMGNCPPGMMCARDPAHDNMGVCSYPCANMNDNCPGEMNPGPHTECADFGAVENASPTDSGCLRPCMMQGDCQNAGVVCAAIPGGNGKSYCIPPGWP